jgi:hypothetical protein
MNPWFAFSLGAAVGVGALLAWHHYGSKVVSLGRDVLAKGEGDVIKARTWLSKHI